MSYHVYTTAGIVLKKRSTGEQNTLLYILTQDLGLIIASARSTRTAKSKLRGMIEEYSYGYFSLVKGKNGWKLTNVSQELNFFFDSPEYSRRTLAQVASVLIKMIQGETPHKKVFEVVCSGFNFIKKIEENNIYPTEILMVLRIMNELGYVEADGEIKSLVSENEFSLHLLEEVERNKIKIVGVINKAIKESQL